MGHGTGCHPLHTLVPAPDRRHGGKARRFRGARRQRRHGGGIFGQAAHPAGIRRLVVPQRRHPLHLRSARLFCLGHGLARIRAGRHLDDSHHFHLLHRRGARLQGSAEKGHPRRGQSRHRRVPLLLLRREESHLEPGMGTGILPRGRRALCHPPGPAHDGTHTDGARIGQEPANGRPLLRLHPRTRGRIHERLGNPSLGTGHPLQDAPQ